MKKIAAALFVWLFVAVNILISIGVNPTFGGVTCTLPFNLLNGTTADATQVMSNYNQLVTCLGNAAAAGANSDITSLLGITTPLNQASGGSVVYTGGTSTGSGNAQVVASPSPINFALTTKSTIIFIAGFTNTGATTLNVNSTGATNVFKRTVNGAVALVGNEIISGTLTAVTFDGTQYELLSSGAYMLPSWGLTQSAATGLLSIATSNPPFGFDMPVNLQLNVTVNSNNLTVAIKGNNGSDPSATNPVLVPFRDVTVANGGPVWVAVTAATSFAANSGSSFGSTSAKISRYWVVGFYNAGALNIGVINCTTQSSTAVTICGLPDDIVASTTACNACGTATAGQTFYTTSALTSQPYRILGYFEATEATAGTWATAPSKIQLFGPGVKKPGDVVQTVQTSTTSTTTLNTTTKIATSLVGTIVPTSAVNTVKVTAYGLVLVANVNSAVNMSIYRGTGTTPIGTTGYSNGNGTVGTGGQIVCFAFDNPQTTSSTQYGLYGWANSGTPANVFLDATRVLTVTPTGVMVIEEIMGSLDVPIPANDNEMLLKMAA